VNGRLWATTAVLALAYGTRADAQAAGSAPGTSRVLDDFESVAAWTAQPSDGVSLRISSDTGFRGRSMRLDVDFQGGGGYAVARRTLPLDFPANYEVSFRIRGNAPRNNVEVKFVDGSGENVWWVNRRDYAFPAEWTPFSIRKRHVSFAWGPLGGGELRRSAALEIAITAGRGGRGTVWIDELTITPRDTVATRPPEPRVTASRGNGSAARALDRQPETAWRSGPGESATLTLDLRGTRELGGLSLLWDPRDYARDYDVETSPDGRSWTRAYAMRWGDGDRDLIPMPETETAWLRLVLQRTGRGRGYALRELALQPIDFGASPNAPWFAAADHAPRGSYPRAFTDSVQSYWTILGAPAAEREAMMSEDGAIEVGKGRFSLEPFLHVDGRLVGWADVRTEQSLEGGDLPIPSVRWTPQGRDSTLGLTTTAFVDGTAGEATLYVRYRVENRGRVARRPTVFVAVRPFQVNPPWQFLNTTGGFAPVRELAWADGRVTVTAERDPVARETILSLTPPTAFGATTLDRGDVVQFLRAGRLPSSQSAFDSLGRASGALSYVLDVPPGGHRDVVLAMRFASAGPVLRTLAADSAASYFEQRLRFTRYFWNERVNGVRLALPPEAERLARTLRATQAYILINQDGPAIQPGSRSYERSWIRDGSLTSAALLRTGHHEHVRAFLEWYAPFQYANGKVPCCVDHRGADPVPEHDSHGQLIFLAREYHAFTGDRVRLARLWPNVVRAVAYIDSLRKTRRTDEYLEPAKRHFFGLMPPSISHEGYSAKPMHSYWDDVFTLRGLKDAASIARTLGRADTARLYQSLADEFRTDLVRSIEAAMRVHGIDFIPGAADLGDFDATSTTVGLAPGGEQHRLPQAALRRTFERYWESHQQRLGARATWENYTPYELRTVGSLVRLGHPERAHAMLDFFFAHQRPSGWYHWAEVVWREPGTPKFIGDMPHTWVGSDFIRSVLDLFAYEEESDSSVVVGAGIPASWARADSGAAVEGLRTPYGLFSVAAREVNGVTTVRLSGTRVPPGGLRVHAPFPRRDGAARVNGAAATREADGTVRVHTLPAVVEFR
jgi:hypothetical protein